MQAALMSGRWVDAELAFAETLGYAPRHTCHTAYSSSRLDAILCNSVAAQALTSVDLLRDTGIPTHIPVMGSFLWPRYGQEVNCVARPRQFPVDMWLEWERHHVDDLAWHCMEACRED
eukprot:7066896-Karenia_brevis.AAC.1